MALRAHRVGPWHSPYFGHRLQVICQAFDTETELLLWRLGDCCLHAKSKSILRLPWCSECIQAMKKMCILRSSTKTKKSLQSEGKDLYVGLFCLNQDASRCRKIKLNMGIPTPAGPMQPMTALCMNDTCSSTFLS